MVMMSPAFVFLAQLATQTFGDAWRSEDRGLSAIVRQVIAYVAHDGAGLSESAIANALGQHKSTIHYSIDRMRSARYHPWRDPVRANILREYLTALNAEVRRQ